MGLGSVEIVATPFQSAVAFNADELSVEVETSLARIRDDGFKYVDNFGFRKLGDPLIDYRHGYKKWRMPQDIELVATCQAQQDQHITSAEIVIDQSSHNHEVYIIDGGIGKENIRILIKIHNAYWLHYEVCFYGEQSVRGEG